MTAKDMRTDLLERVLAAHKSFYDIRRDYLFEGRTFPAFAEYHTYGEKYVLGSKHTRFHVLRMR